MGFIEIKQEMVETGAFERPASFFSWVKESFEKIKEEDITAKLFAFRLLDEVAGVEAHEKIFTEMISYAETLGIKPWPNVVGLRLQASTCLAEFIEGCLKHSG